MFSKPPPRKKVMGSSQTESSFLTISWLILSAITDNIAQEDEQWLGEESELPGETSWGNLTVPTATDQLASTEFRILRVFL